MVRLADILKRQELGRVYFDEHKPASLDKPKSDSGTLTADNLYKELLGMMRQVLADIVNAKQIDLAGLKDKISLVSDFVSKDDGAMLRLIDRYDELEDYLVVHSVNVCILSLEIAKGLNYNREAMLDLGLGAFLLDIGMARARTILQNKRQLYTAEYDEVKNHVTYGLEILATLGQVNDKVLAIISQHHERKDGSGYLKGLKGDEIDEYARIVGLADVYDALIHSRPHRNKFVPFEYETIREIIANRDMFDPYILKVFLERLTRHPAYILWLATNGIYELLRQQEKEPVESEIKPPPKNRYVLIAAVTAIVLAGISIPILKSNINSVKNMFYPLGNTLSIANNQQPLKIPYNFINNPSDAHSVSLDLTGINLEGYHFLVFSSRLDDKKIKKMMRYATLSIAVENARKETANYYIQGLNNRWQEFRIPLSYFDAIRDRSSLNSIAFILQPWNIDSKEGTLYIDNIRFFRKK